MLTLYYTPTACSTASHIAIEESGADYEASLVKLWRPETVETYRAEVNPKGSVPALSIDGTVITENVSILTYLARRFPDARLLPDDPLRQAQCLSTIAWMASTVHIARRQFRAPHKFAADESVHAVLREAGRAAFWANLQKIDALLSPGPWIMGDQFTVADAYALVFYGWALEDGQPLAELPAYSAFKGRMLERPAVLRVLEKERSALLPQPAQA